MSIVIVFEVTVFEKMTNTIIPVAATVVNAWVANTWAVSMGCQYGLLNQSHRFGIAKHQIEILHSGTRGSFD